jgi:hypothetical protein
MSPLDEGSARRGDLYLTTHDNQKRQTSMPSAGFEPTIPASDQPLGPAAGSYITPKYSINSTGCMAWFRYATELDVFWERSSRPVLVRIMIKHSEHVGSTLLHTRRCRDSELRSDIRCSDIFSLLFFSTFWAKSEIMRVIFCHYCLSSLPHQLIILHLSCHSTLCYIR